MFENRRYKVYKSIVKVNGNISGALDIYDKRFIPRTQLLDDYLRVIYRYDKERHINNPFRGEGMRHNPEKILHPITERGTNENEAAFRDGAAQLVLELPTDVIRAAFYDSKNESELEIGVLVKEIDDLIHSGDELLVVNPSPDVILHFEKKNSGKVHYVVSDQTMVDLYKFQFPNSLFSRIDQIEEYLDKKYPLVLIINREYEVGKTSLLMQWITLCCRESIVSIPNTYFEKASYNAESLLGKNGLALSEIVLIDGAVLSRMTSTKKRVISHIVRTSENDTKCKMFTSEYLKQNKEFVISDVCATVDSKIWKYGKTLKQLLNPSNVIDRETQKYSKAQAFIFSDEISLFYKIYENRKNRYSGRVYYCELVDAIEGKYGNSVSPLIEKGLRGETYDEVYERIEMIAFREEIYPYIVKDIRTHYLAKDIDISVKSIWFMCRFFLLQRKDYREEIILELFHKAKDCLNVFKANSELSEILIDCLEQILGEDDKADEYYEQLDYMFQTAIVLGYAKYNPIAIMIPRIRKRASERQQEVRQASVKKSLSDAEEERVVKYLFEKKSGKYCKNQLPYCVMDEKALAGVMRLFSGVSIREVCALLWEDYREIEDTGTYQLCVTKYIDESCKVVPHSVSESVKRFRFVPIPKVLSIILNMRRDYILNAGINEDEISKLPIIFNCEDGKKRVKKKAFYDISKIQESSRSILKVAEIPEQWLVLPDASGEMTTDIYKYHGDLYVSNLKSRLNNECGLTNGEYSNIIGIKADDTFSRHYCDYNNVIMQYATSHKIDRWANKYLYLLFEKNEGKCGMERITEGGKYISGPFYDACSRNELIIESYADDIEEITISIKAEHGFDYNISEY